MLHETGSSGSAGPEGKVEELSQAVRMTAAVKLQPLQDFTVGARLQDDVFNLVLPATRRHVGLISHPPMWRPWLCRPLMPGILQSGCLVVQIGARKTASMAIA